MTKSCRSPSRQEEITFDTIRPGRHEPRDPRPLKPTSRCRRPTSSPTAWHCHRGDAPGITDGAAATRGRSERAVDGPMAQADRAHHRLRQADVAPKWLFVAPITVSRKLIEKIGLAIDDFDLVEINEAFAAQVMADGTRARLRLGQGQRQRRRDRARPPDRRLRRARSSDARCTSFGGARNAGSATLCLGGGGAVAMAFEPV